jgi:hypothetical protein
MAAKKQEIGKLKMWPGRISPVYGKPTGKTGTGEYLSAKIFTGHRHTGYGVL